MHALLITRDDRVIQEFVKIAAVTQTKLIVSESPSGSEITQSYRVFVASDLAGAVIDHDEIVFVVVGATDSSTWQSAMQLNAKHVVTIPDSRDWLIANLTPPITNLGSCISVVPAVGGAGASLLAAGFSHHARQIFNEVALVDTDFDSAGLDIMLGMESQTGMRWQDFTNLTGAISGNDIFRSLPTRDGVGLLTHGLVKCRPESLPISEILKQLQTSCGLVVVDLPRFTGKKYQIEVLNQSDLTLVTTPTTVRGCASAKHLLTRLRDQTELIELVVRKIPGSNLDPLHIAEMLDTPLAATISSDTRIVEQVEQGFGIVNIHLGSFTRSLNALAHRIANVRENLNAA